MLSEIENHLGAVERKVVSLEKDGVQLRSVILSQSYETTIEDLWDAVTNRERLPRWFAPVEGDLQLGGTYQVKGNAGGKIVECESPDTFSLTWEIFGDVSWVDVTFKAEGPKSARLTLTHTAKLSSHWEQYGPGATGVGWEFGLLGLAIYFANPDAEKVDEEAFATSTEGKAFIRGWGDAAISAGEASERARNSTAQTAAFYTGESGVN